MAVDKADVKEVVSALEMQGRGTLIDYQTILIGLAPNDNLTPEELEALGDEAVQQPRRSPYSIEQFAEPDQTGGIPVWFTGVTTPPMGGGRGGGAQASGRRGGGGGQFVEPNAN
jgi:hypothetical protein